MNGSTIDWNEYTDEDIERFVRELAFEQEKRRQEKRQALKEQINTLLTENGLTLSDVFGNQGKTRGRSTGNRQDEPRPVKYRNPDNPVQTWTGTGRQPAWVKEALANGRTLAEFAVCAETPLPPGQGE